MKSGVRQKHLCGAASGAAARATLGGCVDVPHVCIRGEQLLLHGSLDALPDVMRLLNRTRDPSDAFSLLRPYERPTALPPPDGPYDYLPIAVGARRSRGRRRPRFLVRAPAPPRNVTFSDDDAVVFFTSWSNSFTEIFSRAVVRAAAILAQFWRNSGARAHAPLLTLHPPQVRVFEPWCRTPGGRRRLHLRPAMWGSDWGPDYAHFWLEPFSAHPVQPLAATPRALVKSIWRTLASDDDYAAYANQSRAMFAARKPPHCFARARVCDFTSLPKPHAARPWSTVQAVAAYHAAVNDTVRTAVRAGAFLPAATATAAAAAQLTSEVVDEVASRRAAAPFGQRRGGVERSANGSRELRRSACAAGESMDGGGCALAITFANRLGRRKLQNLHELVAACNAWRPAAAPGLRVRCTAHNFGVGLVLSLAVLARTDVLILPHGADLINGFALHAAASVVEVMPVHQGGCPCTMYKNMFTKSPGMSRRATPLPAMFALARPRLSDSLFPLQIRPSSTTSSPPRTTRARCRPSRGSSPTTPTSTCRGPRCRLRSSTW